MLTRNIALFMLLAASLAAGAYVYLAEPRSSAPPQSADSPATAAGFDAAAPVEQRLAALEEALGVERQARQLLQEELVVMTAELERLSADRGPVSETVTPVGSVDDSGNEVQRSRNSRRSRNDPEVRIERMVAAGFSQVEAERIMRRESELQMEALQARYDARRSGESVSFFTGGATRDALRSELGDDGYARYLSANGRPTSVTVSSVLEGSPALTAGLRPGDQIVNYDGRRVFSMDEITRLAMEGEPRQNVLVDIDREGVLMQVSLPRGPLGVTGGRRFPR